VIRRVCWFVRSQRSCFLEKEKYDFHEMWHRCSASFPDLTVNITKVRVIVQGQTHSTEILSLVA